ncbi:sortase A [Streptomyces sp. PvR006]|uniref:class E sortase n=1 Tax=Streptomyces sp. PvR006 TaxID=2817860 RepID=UPI001AE2AD63|nr:class E sortase [Streptomyces sp. PvR006]MBP2583330.1 sortase A [Streptomyces sp. PvR006]
MTTGSPWFRDTNEPEPEPIPADPYGVPSPYQEPAPAPYPYPEQTAYQEPRQSAYQEPQQAQQPYQEPAQTYGQPAQTYREPEPVYEAPYAPAYDVTPEAPHEDAHTPPYEPYEAPEAPRAPRASRRRSSDDTAVPEAVEAVEALPGPVPGAVPEPLPGPGRAERRRAAKGGSRGKSRRGGPAATAAGAPGGGATAAGAPAAPLSRVEARRAARAAKDSVGVIASRAVGELFITFGVVMLLFVTYQLWWTNVLAGQETDRAKEQIEDTWAKDDGAEDDSKPGAFEPGEGFAIMYIPKLDVVVPVAEGINKAKVLDKGMVGHYAEGSLKTAMPSDKQGNFAVAGHRNTHGEPFRYINRLQPGDPIVVETRTAYYTYEMASILPQTAPSNVSVIEPVPKGSGFTKPGRFITLTTCTPEFTSTYRMIVWGKLVEERPRSQGKPKALVG